MGPYSTYSKGGYLMKSKIICGILTATIGLSMVSITAFAKTPDSFNAPTMNEAETICKDPKCHKGYAKLVSAMMSLVEKKVFSTADIEKVHTYYNKLQTSDPESIPTTDIGLLDALLKANVITKVQYDQVAALLK